MSDVLAGVRISRRVGGLAGVACGVTMGLMLGRHGVHFDTAPLILFGLTLLMAATKTGTP